MKYYVLLLYEQTFKYIGKEDSISYKDIWVCVVLLKALGLIEGKF